MLDEWFGLNVTVEITQSQRFVNIRLSGIDKSFISAETRDRYP